MSAKPLRNSRGVNKQFRSPFSTTPRNKNTENVANTPESKIRETASKDSVAKKTLFTTPAKKLRLSDENCEDRAQVEQDTELRRADLELIQKRIQEKQKSINNLRTVQLYKKKNPGEDLETEIRKYTDVCQTGLRDYQNLLQERNGQPIGITEILSSLSIDPAIAGFSTDDETFYRDLPLTH